MWIYMWSRKLVGTKGGKGFESANKKTMRRGSEALQSRNVCGVGVEVATRAGSSVLVIISRYAVVAREGSELRSTVMLKQA